MNKYKKSENILKRKMSYPDDLKRRLINSPIIAVHLLTSTMSGPVVSAAQLKFRLPSNSLIELSSLAIHAHMKTVDSGGATTGGKVAYYPCRDLNIIRRLTIEMENNTVCVIENYDRIRSMLLNYSMGQQITNSIFMDTET